MKNAVKILGIIAAIAVIGIFAGCGPAEPDDQTRIALDLEGYDGTFATVMIFDSIPKELPDPNDLTTLNNLTTINDKKVKTLAYSSPKEFDDGYVSLPLFEMKKKAAGYEKTADAVTVDKGVVALWINSSENMKGDELYKGKTERVVALGKGTYTIDIKDFTPTLKSKVPDSEYLKTYEASYTNSNSKAVVETIKLTKTRFYVSDDVNTTKDYLDFKIERWDEVDVPEGANYSGYDGAYRFTGKIVGQKNYVPSTYTAPKFSKDDVDADGNGPTCWMYIYFKKSGNDITFIRSSFSKSGNVNSGLVIGGDNKPRVYEAK